MTICSSKDIADMQNAITIPRDVIGGIKMQRDMEVVRRVLKAIQERQDLRPSELKIDGMDDFIVGYHTSLLYDAGYIDGTVYGAYSDAYKRVHVKDLTWEGHDFISALGNETVWAKLKSSVGVKELATMPLSVVKAVGIGLLEAWLKKEAGL